MKITSILPSFLGEYNGCATDRERKFERAVDSFLQQQYGNKELIIVSDGCEITNNIVRTKYPHSIIKLLTIDKQPIFSGKVREIGLKQSDSDIITYLDSDDLYGNDLHLDFIYNAFLNENIDWIYFDDIVRWNPHVSSQREAILEDGKIGTSNIAHRNYKDISWDGLDFYGHDWYFINNLIQKYKNVEKITGTSYTVCHIPNSVDI